MNTPHNIQVRVSTPQEHKDTFLEAFACFVVSSDLIPQTVTLCPKQRPRRFKLRVYVTLDHGYNGH